ncbi:MULTISPECIES: hypothetical protein [unclassified Salinibacterium]|uniref:hypothetical protein n=1 Tax=unclassified Salinibacterium TaxID=2632331 RepID=UPI0018CE65D7|nr:MULTISPECIES: hypothetical protein [unclassified Salinibacterium]MBH0053124.1 hypothetical protein [Salinibacterium sp. SWN139]MBH0082390.1 hypothetical protein [Salinibacterium sp. SWN167]
MINILNGDVGESRPALYVDSTGLAVVHEGEWVLPAEGAAAKLSAAEPGIVVEVPIEIIISMPVSDADRRAIADLVLGELRDALDAEVR